MDLLMAQLESDSIAHSLDLSDDDILRNLSDKCVRSVNGAIRATPCTHKKSCSQPAPQQQGKHGGGTEGMEDEGKRTATTALKGREGKNWMKQAG